MRSPRRPDEPCKLEQFVDKEGKTAFRWVYSEEKHVEVPVEVVQPEPVVAKPEVKKKKR